MERKRALVTGASSGIGREIARIFAENGTDLILSGRDNDRLQQLKKEIEERFAVHVSITAVDLSLQNAGSILYNAVTAGGYSIDYLVNCAGFGGHGLFHEQDWEKDRSMISVNITALTELTRRFLPEMIGRGHGHVLNIASTSAFLPGPLQAVYYASKAYVLSFTQAVDEELTGTGVRATVFCPGATDTSFAKRGGLTMTRLFRKHGKSSARKTAQKAYNAMTRGRMFGTNDLIQVFVLRFVLPFLPRRLVVRISRYFMEKMQSHH